MKARRHWLPVLTAGIGAVVLLLTGACAAAATKEPPGGGFGLFSWEPDVMLKTEKNDLNACIRQAGVKRIYQEIPEENLTQEETPDFIRRMRARSVEVYALVGDAEWAYEKDGGSLRYDLKQIAAYNEGQKPDARIAGVMVDVEPYLLDEWNGGGRSRQRLMERYLSGIKAGYAYAEENGLEFWVCIPMFYDSTNKEILEELISEGCDGIAIMNYDRTDEYMQIAMEVGYAREYRKGVVCIYELQEPGKHELEEINTYSEIGLEPLWESAQRLKKQFGYDRLEFAYHYYKPLQEMLAKKG